MPLNQLLKKKVVFHFNDDNLASFTKLKEALTSDKVIEFPNFEGECILRTDVSGFALGAVLSNAYDKPIAYASRRLVGLNAIIAQLKKYFWP